MFWAPSHRYPPHPNLISQIQSQLHWHSRVWIIESWERHCILNGPVLFHLFQSQYLLCSTSIKLQLAAEWAVWFAGLILLSLKSFKSYQYSTMSVPTSSVAFRTLRSDRKRGLLSPNAKSAFSPLIQSGPLICVYSRNPFQAEFKKSFQTG